MTATSFAPEKLSSLKSSEPAQPMPAGRLEFWGPTQTTGMRIVLVRDANTQTLSEADVRQVWPPIEHRA